MLRVLESVGVAFVDHRNLYGTYVLEGFGKRASLVGAHHDVVRVYRPYPSGHQERCAEEMEHSSSYGQATLND